LSDGDTIPDIGMPSAALDSAHARCRRGGRALGRFIDGHQSPRIFTLANWRAVARRLFDANEKHLPSALLTATFKVAAVGATRTSAADANCLAAVGLVVSSAGLHLCLRCGLRVAGWHPVQKSARLFRRESFADTETVN